MYPEKILNLLMIPTMKQSSSNFENKIDWLHLQTSIRANISIRDFAEKHMEPILNKLSLENNNCLLMGDL